MVIAKRRFPSRICAMLAGIAIVCCAMGLARHVLLERLNQRRAVFLERKNVLIEARSQIERSERLRIGLGLGLDETGRRGSTSLDWIIN